MKTIFYTFLVVFASQSLFSQANLAVEDLLNRTEISICKAQKEMIAEHTAKKPQELSSAIKFQVLAVEAFKKSDFKAAVCYSLKGREYVNDILIQMKLTGVDAYLANQEEKNLAQHYNYNTNDEGLKAQINSGVIEDDVLFDLYKMKASYLISIH